jgi:glycosyltransferase involved in cell wall biosynthesis
MAQVDMVHASMTRQQGPATPAPDLHGLTVHVVGRLTPPVLSFVLPAMRAIHAMGRPQLLVFIEDAYSREQALALPPDVHCVRVSDHRTAVGRSRALLEALQRAAVRDQVTVLHLHGVLPWLAAMWWQHGATGPGPEIVFTPHSSRALVSSSLLRNLVSRLFGQALGRVAGRSVVNSQSEARLVSSVADVPIDVVECPVSPVFLAVQRREAGRPLLISCNLQGQRSAVDGFIRIAVLLNDDALGITFNWVGRAEPEAAAALRAAGVGQFDVSTDESRALRLGTAWVYVAACDERGFPIRLVEAMAAGLPCVALDNAVHRNVVVDGVTGYLCADQDRLLARIAELVDLPQQRQRMGRAARDLARRRFSEGRFRVQLERALEVSTTSSTATRATASMALTSDAPEVATSQH